MYEIFEKLLMERGVTAYKVAKATGISTGSMTDWKKGRSAPKVDKLQKIADYFGVSVDYLLGNEPKEKTPAEADVPLTISPMPCMARPRNSRTKIKICCWKWRVC